MLCGARLRVRAELLCGLFVLRTNLLPAAIVLCAVLLRVRAELLWGGPLLRL
jgi:hypothetical protein